VILIRLIDFQNVKREMFFRAVNSFAISGIADVRELIAVFWQDARNNGCGDLVFRPLD
jgi:hypothetical protein